MAAHSLERVKFGAFQFDARTGELWREGTALRLQPQPAKVLAILVSRAGEVVTRQELVQQVWGAETFVDFEQGLNYAIRQIRNALKDEADSPRYLETLPKRGYRFLADVEETPETEGAETPAAIAGGLPAAGETAGVLFRLRNALIVFGVVVAGSMIAWYFAASPRAGEREAIRSVAVLPLVNLSDDPAQEYFSDGLTDELITELAKLPNLRVISRTSVSGYKGTRRRASEIARELHVDAIVEGTMERAENRVRIRAQLIQGSTDQHLWASSYDGDVSDLLRLESNVARDIARKIGLLASQQSATAVQTRVPAAAHEDYLRGRYYWNKRTEAGIRKGIEYFQKAIDQEPNYALAYAGLADSYIVLANWGFAPPAESYARAKAAALKALERDAQLAEAHTSLAYVTLLYEWNWRDAESRFRQAIAINPNYVSAHHFYSICLMTEGRQAEAVSEIQRAQELDPLSLIVIDVAGWIYYEGRQYDQAIQLYKKALEMDPNYVPALLDLGTAYLRLGDYSAAIAQFEKARGVEGDKSVVLSNLAQAYALSGKRKQALQILRTLHQPSERSFVSSWDLSLIYAALGEKRKAIELLSQAADERVGWVIRLGVDPALDTLRGESQFQRLTQRVGIATGV